MSQEKNHNPADIARDPETSTEKLEALFNQYRDDTRADGIKSAIASNENTSPEILNELANSGFWGIRAEVAKNPSTTAETLTELSTDRSDMVRWEIAKNANTTAEILTNLAQDPETEEAVADNPNTPSSVLDILSASEQSATRMNVASNESTSGETLEKLAKDENEAVRIFVAENIWTPNWTLRELENDKDFMVRDSVKETFEKKRELNELVRVSEAKDTPPEKLAELSKHKVWQVRAGVAGNENTPAEVLHELAKEPNTTEGCLIRLHLIDNPNIPYDTQLFIAETDTSSGNLNDLSKDEDRYLRTLISANQHTDAKTLERLYQEANSAQPLEDGAEYDAEFTETDEMNNGYDEEIRMNVVTHENVSTELLESVKGHSWEDPEFGYRHFETDKIKEAAEANLASRSKEQTKEAKNKYAAKYQKTSEKLAERDASSGLGE